MLLINNRFKPEAIVTMKYRMTEYEAKYYLQNLWSKCNSKRFKSFTRLLGDMLASHALGSRWRSTSVCFENYPQHFISMMTQKIELLGSRLRSGCGVSNTL